MFDLIQIIYWLALSSWFGAVLFVAIAAPVIVRTVRDAKPVLPDILSVNLEGQHGTLLAGSIIARIMNVVGPIELACAGAMLLALIGQWALLQPTGSRMVLPILRTAMYLAAVGLLIYDRRIVWPRIMKYRQEYLDNADNPDIANPALDQFDRYQTEGAMVLRNILFLLLGVILFSANIRPVQFVEI